MNHFYCAFMEHESPKRGYSIYFYWKRWTRTCLTGFYVVSKYMNRFFFLCRTSCCSVGRMNRKSGPASPSSWNYSRNCRNATVACLTQYTSGNQLSMWNELNSKMPVSKKTNEQKNQQNNHEITLKWSQSTRIYRESLLDGACILLYLATFP